MRTFICLLVAATLTACTPPTGTPVDKVKDKSAQVQVDDAKLQGEWRIVSLNGSPIVGLDSTRAPAVKFWPNGYGGNTGCNDFGGQGLLRAGRYFTQAGPMTAVACASLNDQETAITTLMRERPQVSLTPDGKLTLTSKSARLELIKDEAAGAQMQGQISPVPDLILAGTTWQITSVNGAWLTPRNQRESRPLTFEADRWLAKPACATLLGTWRQKGRTIEVSNPKAEKPNACPENEAATDAAVVAIMQANPSFTSGNLLGPNSELLIASDDQWLTASRNPGP